jgi:GntR family transcriptional regulator / MocR family aminotransferase
LTVDLPEGADECTIIAEGQRQLIGLYGTGVYYARPDTAPPGLLLGYRRLSARAANEGVRRLAQLIKPFSGRPQAVVKIIGPGKRNARTST